MVVLQWISSHCSLLENEKVDKLAKGGCHTIVALNGDDGYKSVSSKINMTFKDKQLSQLKGKKDKYWEGSVYNPPDYPKCTAVAAFHLTIMLDCLYAYLQRFQIVDSPACPF